MIVFEDEHLILALHLDAGEGDTAIITFAEMRLRPDGARIWGQAPLRRLGVPCAGFVARDCNWYPASSMERAAPVLRRALERGGFRRAVGYGYSMGAYAALRFGRLLGLDAALALSPQASIDPVDVADPRFNRFHDPVRSPRMRIGSGDGAGRNWIIVDPQEPLDRRHADAIAARVPVSVIPLRGAGHDTARALASTAWLNAAIGAVASDDPGKLRAASRSFGQANPDRACNLANQVRLRRTATAARLWQRHYRVRDHRKWLPTLFTLAGRGWHDEIAASVQAAREAGQDPPYNLMILAQCAFRRGEPERAAELARAFKAASPAADIGAFLARLGGPAAG